MRSTNYSSFYKHMKKKAPRIFDSLQDWMEKTGNNQACLREMLAERCGIKISHAHMSAVLTGRFRCSLGKAIALSAITGVPVEKLVEWPRRQYRKQVNTIDENKVTS